jgi:hypothetical protein
MHNNVEVRRNKYESNKNHTLVELFQSLRKIIQQKDYNQTKVIVAYQN